jgi:hypothetical protein
VRELLDAQAGIEHPLPGGAGDDERDRHGIEKDRAQRAFLPDALIEQDGEQQPEEHADHDIENAEHREVVQGDAPARLGPDALVLKQADQLVHGISARLREREVRGPEDESVHEHQRDQHARGQHQLGQQLLQPRSGRRCCAGLERLGVRGCHVSVLSHWYLDELLRLAPLRLDDAYQHHRWLENLRNRCQARREPERG